MIQLENVSKFYGDILGVNKVSLSIAPGVTGLVGPNGSGKTTLMNLMTGLVRPTRGRVTVLGVSPDLPELLFARVGYCPQFDSFPGTFTGRQFIHSFLRIHGYSSSDAYRMTNEVLERVNLLSEADKVIDDYSKGMRQKIKLAQSIAHHPEVLILDEPLNGLDPIARAETMSLFREAATEGRHVIISSHILHDVESIAERVILLKDGFVVAEGDARKVRGEMPDRPSQILIRCDRPSTLAARLFEQDHVVEARIQDDLRGLVVKTRDPGCFYLVLNNVIVEGDLEIESVAPIDDDLDAVYKYLIHSEQGGNS